MRNKYEGTCYRCSRYVAKGDGHFQKSQGGWRVQHAKCAIAFRSMDSRKFTLPAERNLKKQLEDHGGQDESAPETKTVSCLL